MEKYKYDESNGLWYELQGDYYLPCLQLPEEEPVHIGVWGQRHLNYLRENKRLLLHHRTRRIQAAGHRHRVLREGHEKGYRLRSYQVQGHPGRAAGGLPESLRPV